MKIIHGVYGLAELKDKTLTKKYIIENYGNPDEEIDQYGHSSELIYKKKGLIFFLKKEEKKEKKEIEVISIVFKSPFTGRTEEGIVLNESTMAKVFKIYGKENWLTTSDSKYYWVEYSGISFYVKRNEKEFVFKEKENLKKKIIRITVPVKYRPDEIIRNEKGKFVKSVNDFCIDGKLHQVIFDRERSERICSKCGLILADHIISMEYSGVRAFSKAERERRKTHGSPVNPLIPDLQMATMINKRAPMPPALKKAVKWDSRYTWKQRNMIQATSEIKRIGGLLNLPNHVKVYSIQLYRKAFTLGLLKGRSIRGMVSAAIYYACGAEKIPRTLQNVVDVSDSTFHQITKCYQSLIRELKLVSPTMKPGLLISNYVAKLNLTHDVEIFSQKILKTYEKVYTLSGKDPKGLVAAALYISAQRYNLKVSQTKISRAVGITEVTLRNRLREMMKYIKSKKK